MENTLGTSSNVPSALIMAEGGSDRLRPLTDHLPTALLPVGGVPILDRQIQSLLVHGVRNIVVVGGYRAIQVEQACRLYPKVRFLENTEFSLDLPRFSALARALPLGKGPLLILPGDLVVTPELLVPLVEEIRRDALVRDTESGSLGGVRLTAKGVERLAEEGDPQGELYPQVEALIEARRGKRMEGDCVRVTSMEALARSLKHFGRGQDAVSPAGTAGNASPRVAVVAQDAALKSGNPPGSGSPFFLAPLLRGLVR